MNYDLSLGLLLTEPDIVKLRENSFLKFLTDQIQLFDTVFETCVIIIDSIDKSKDPPITDVSFILDYFSTRGILVNISGSTIFPLKWGTERKQILQELNDVFKSPLSDLTPAYKNTVAHIFSYIKCPTKFMFHIDIPRPRRAKYSSAEYGGVSFVEKSIQILEDNDDIAISNSLGCGEAFVCKNNPRIILNTKNTRVYTDETYAKYKTSCDPGICELNKYGKEVIDESALYQVHFDGKPNVGLQCCVYDISKIQGTFGKWKDGYYKFQFENQLIRQLQQNGLSATALITHQVYPMKRHY